MNKPFLILGFLVFFVFNCTAQVTWEKLFVRSNTDVFRSVQEVPAGGYIAAGYTSQWSSSDTDAYVVRFNVNGDTLWTRTFNGGKKDLFYKVINTSDGGFMMCGYSSSYSTMGDDDAYYMKLDVNGNELWHFTYGGNLKERAQDIIETFDGGFAMCGYSNSGTGAQGYNAFLVKMDAAGSQTWSMKYGTTAFEDANSVKEILPGGDFILAGQQSPGSLGLGDIWLVRTNSTGGQLWTQNIGTASNDNAENIQLVPGGFIICGSTETLADGDQGYLVKTDDLGVVLWSKTFGGSSNDDFHYVNTTSDGGYIITGTTQSNAAIISNIWLFKTDANGDSTWAYVFGGENHDHGYGGVQTSDGGYILCGYTASFGFNYEDALVIKVDSNGQLFNHLFYTTVTALVSPVNGACGSASSLVTVTVRNFGDTAVASIPITVEISGALTDTLQETRFGTVIPPNFVNYTFATTINTSAGGTFNFHCYTSNNNDVYPAMNWHDSSITLGAQPLPPAATGDTTCGPGLVTLTAASPDNTDWYDSLTGGSFLGSGTTYSTSIAVTTTFYVQASNSCGTSARTAVTAHVFPVTPQATVYPAQRCGPGDVTLLASSGNPISWWSDQTGGTMLQGDTNSYIANVSSTTTFYVEAGTGSTCPSVRVPVTATVNPLPVAGFTSNAPAVCLGDLFQFINLSTGASAYFWDFGDASGTSSQTDPSYTYALTGSYTVQLIAVSAQTCYDTTTLDVAVNLAPQVSFTSLGNTGCIPFNASFINNTTNATDYLWNFGDGFTSTDPNPVHGYQSSGTFTVTLLATVGSCSDSDSVVGMITTYTPPVFDFPTDSIISNAVTYVLDAGAGYATYQWNNGATTQTITADTNGLYCVVVTDGNSCTDSDCIYVLLDAAGFEYMTVHNDLLIYPNPASGWFKLSGLWSRGSPASDVRIYDATGRMVFSQKSDREILDIDAATWPAGFYMVEVQSGAGVQRVKLMLN